jgi:hypothetical protein
MHRVLDVSSATQLPLQAEWQQIVQHVLWSWDRSHIVGAETLTKLNFDAVLRQLLLMLLVLPTMFASASTAVLSA